MTRWKLSFSLGESPNHEEQEEDLEEKTEDESGEQEPDSYTIISFEDSPELFPFLVEQFFQFKKQFPSMCCSTIHVDIHNFCRESLNNIASIQNQAIFQQKKPKYSNKEQAKSRL